MKLRIRVGQPVFSFLPLILLAVTTYASDVTILDLDHFSKVFGETRNFRIFLPPTYNNTSENKRYPVIYFYHGWSQRYFGSSDPYGDFDKGDENGGDNIANFVTTHDVIVVKPDGYNRGLDEEYYVRPYNIGPVETYRQFPLYFPELVEHIDSRFRTIADRAHRAISGLSMGGFMTFWIAGKYPHLVTAAGNFCGSPEFVVGPKGFPVEYRHLDMYNNYAGLKLRLHYGDKDFIRGYHEDMNSIWPQVIDNYSWKIYDAAHSTCGLTDMFDFIMETFENPIPEPNLWHHIDVYPSFSVWNYQINTNREIPGFTVLKDVSKRGFRSSVKEFLPDGDLMPYVDVSITTAPIYAKNEIYVINDVNVKSLKTQQWEVESDNEGRLVIPINGGLHEIGINKRVDKPNLCVASTHLENSNWVSPLKDISLSITILNKGLSPALSIEGKLACVGSHVKVKQNKCDFNSVDINEVREGKNPFVFQVMSDSISIVKFKLTLQDKFRNEWIDFFEMAVKPDAPIVKEFVIADGQTFTVAKGGDETETIKLGSGNGNGVANPGESIFILVKDREKYWRTKLSTSDQYINPFGINHRMSDYWGRYDHVGASAKYSAALISSDCPQNHMVDIFAEYWLPDNRNRIIRGDVVKIKIVGKDITPPQVSWAQIDGDNTIRVKVSDGSKVKMVRARFIQKKDLTKFFDVDLKKLNEGSNTEMVFIKKIPDQGFGIYRMEITATDSFGNQKVTDIDKDFIIH